MARVRVRVRVAWAKSEEQNVVEHDFLRTTGPFSGSVDFKFIRKWTPKFLERSQMDVS